MKPIRQSKDTDELIRRGYAETYIDTEDGKTRLRLTPAGARFAGNEETALGLEACKRGDHKRVLKGSRCWCGEQSGSN